MRLICPNCDAQYEVDAAMLPPEGRDVQCSACGQIWFHDPSAAPRIPADAWARGAAPRSDQTEPVAEARFFSDDDLEDEDFEDLSEDPRRSRSAPVLPHPAAEDRLPQPPSAEEPQPARQGGALPDAGDEGDDDDDETATPRNPQEWQAAWERELGKSPGDDAGFDPAQETYEEEAIALAPTPTPPEAVIFDDPAERAEDEALPPMSARPSRTEAAALRAREVMLRDDPLPGTETIDTPALRDSPRQWAPGHWTSGQHDPRSPAPPPNGHGADEPFPAPRQEAEASAEVPRFADIEDPTFDGLPPDAQGGAQAAYADPGDPAAWPWPEQRPDPEDRLRHAAFAEAPAAAPVPEDLHPVFRDATPVAPPPPGGIEGPELPVLSSRRLTRPTGPLPPEEDEEDDDEPFFDADPAELPPRRPKLDEEKLSLLREEAERESRARAAEAARAAGRGLEMQPDLGLPETEPPVRLHIGPRVSPPEPEEIAVPSRPVAQNRGARRELLPDIERINQTLAASSGAGKTASPQAARAAQRRGFRLGFLLSLAAAVLLAMAYVNAPLLAEALPPQAAPLLEGYVALVDAARLKLDEILRQVLDSQTL